MRPLVSDQRVLPNGVLRWEALAKSPGLPTLQVLLSEGWTVGSFQTLDHCHRSWIIRKPRLWKEVQVEVADQSVAMVLPRSYDTGLPFFFSFLVRFVR